MLKVFDLAELTKHHSTLSRPIVWVAAAACLSLFLLVFVWLFKGAIAAGLLSQYCASRDLSCTTKLSTLTLGQIEARSIEIGPRGQAPSLVADRVEADLVWRGFQPSVSKVTINAIDLSIGFDGSELDLRGLDRFTGGGGGPAPELKIEGGKLSIETPAGRIDGTFAANGRLPDEFAAQLDLVPTQLSTADGALDLRTGRANLANNMGSISGDLALDVRRFEIAGTELEDLQIQIDRGQQAEIIAWSLSASRVKRQARTVEDIDSSGVISFEPNADHTLFDRVDRIEGAGTTGWLASNEHAAAESAFIFSLKATRNADADLTAELALLDLTGNAIAADDATLIYNGEIDVRRQSLSGGGELIINGGALADQLSQRLFTGSTHAGPFSAHLAHLKRALVAAGSSFDTRIRFDADADLSGQWQVLVRSTLGLVSETGLVASLSPGLAGPVLSATPGDITLSGVAAISGGSMPDLDADIRQFRVSNRGSFLTVGGLQLDPWKVDGTTTSAKLNRSTFQWTDKGLSTGLIGQVDLAGDVFGWHVRNGRLFGSLDARSDAKGLRVQMLDSDCLGIAFDAATGANALTVGPVSTAICPEDRRLLEQAPGGSEGQLSLGETVLPLSGANLTGHARLARTDLYWRADDALFMKLDTPSIDLDLEIAGRSFQMAGSTPSMEIDLGRATRIDASLGETALSGDLVPASVAIPAVSFQGALLDGRFEGNATAPQTLISDRREDPLFEPILADIAVQFFNSDLTGGADLFLAEDSFQIGEAGLELNLVTLDGMAQVRSNDLVFAPDGLQPTELSERVRGLLTNARGGLFASADLNLDSGALSGTGRVAISDLGFDTLRLGRVSDVDGEIVFDDLLALTTPPAQTIKVGSVEPGIALENGTIQFQLLGNGDARLETATWPFAGGNLIVQPVRWTIAGQRDTIQVSTEEIELAGLIEEFQLPDLEADGTVSGLVPISFESGNVLIEDALLVADERGGYLKYTGQSVSAVETQDVRVNSAFQALRDFRFSVLELGIDGNLIGELALRLKLLGYNPDVLGGAEFSFNISIDSRFIDLIQSGRRALGTEWLAEATLGAAAEDSQDPDGD